MADSGRVPGPWRIAIMISGRGSNMAALADAVEDGRIAGAKIAAVISDQPLAAGLGRARDRGLEAIAIERRGRDRRDHEDRIISVLKERQVDLVCLAGYMRLLAPEFIAAFPNRILNVHPSLLPSFPGLHPQRQALAYGVKWSGCTVHLVDESVDGGPVLEQRIVPVEEDDTEEALAARILVQEHIAYVSTVARLIKHGYEVEGRRVIFKR